MSQFGLDNAGSGFNLDEDEDLDAMFNKAASASEDSGDDDVLHQKKDEKTDFDSILGPDEDSADYEPEPAVEVAPEPEPTPEPVIEESPEPEPVPAPVKAPAQPKAAKPAPKPEPKAEPAPAARRPGVRVPTEAEQIADTARVVRVLDTYRGLSKEEKSVTVQFVTNGDMDAAEDEVVVVKVLNADPQLSSTMRSLREAWEAEPVERAFYTIALPSKTLHSLGELVSVFSGDDFDPKLENLAYSRQVVAAIAKLSEREINFVKATESVLAAAEEPQS